MNKRPCILGLLAFLATSLWLISGGCSSSPVAGPVAGVETSNGNGFVALLPTGAPAANATVRIIDHAAWSNDATAGTSAVVDSAQTDAQGRFFVDEAYYHNYNIQIDATTGGQVLRRYQFSGSPTSIDTVRLHSYISLSGTAISQSGLAKSVHIAGSTYQATVAANGTYTLAGVPAIPLDIFISVQNQAETILAWAKSIAAPPQAGMLVESLTVTPNRVLIDDFSSGIIWSTVLGATTGGGQWFPFSDLDLGGASSALIDIAKDAAATSGNVLKLDAIISKASATHYAGCGILFGQTGTQSEYFNLSSMTSFTFMARASKACEMSVYFTSQAHAFQSEGVSLGTDISLTDQWITFNIPSDSLSAILASTGDTISWQQAVPYVNKLQFSPVPTAGTTNDSITVWIGDVYINGINAGDLFR